VTTYSPKKWGVSSIFSEKVLKIYCLKKKKDTKRLKCFRNEILVCAPSGENNLTSDDDDALIVGAPI
jgi:hypothetical protein